MLETLGQLLGVLAGVLLVAVVAAFAFHLGRKQRARDADVFAASDRCFIELARRRELRFLEGGHVSHPMSEPIPFPGSVRGSLDGFELSLEVEGVNDEDAQTVLRLRSPKHAPAWPPVTRPCGNTDDLPPPARAAMASLCARSRTVEIDTQALTALPAVAGTTDWSGRRRWIETDPDRLDAWLELTLEVARALRSASPPYR